MKSLYRSFAGGEITPEMFGRVDLAKFQTGLQKCLNFITLPHGPAARRPGTQFCGNAGRPVATSAGWLVPFIYSDSLSFVLCFQTDGSFIAYSNGGPSLTTPINVTGISGTTDQVLTVGVSLGVPGISTGDAVYITGSSQAYQALVLTSFTLKLRHPITNAVVTLPAGAGTGQIQAANKVTAGTAYLSGVDWSTVRYAQNGNLLTLTTGTNQAVQISIVLIATQVNWSVVPCTFATTQAAPIGLTITPTVAVATNLTSTTYVVTALAADGVTESLASGSASGSNNLTLAGNFNTISWTAAAGATRYYVYKRRGGVFGYIGQTTGTSIVDDNILPDTTVTPPESTLTLNDTTGNYPRAVTYYERRRVFAGTDNNPQTVWATRNAAESNLTTSVPSRDDDAMQFTIAAQQRSQIQHLVPLTDIVALTTSGEYRIFSDGGPALSPSTLSVKAQGFSGASPVQPALTERTALYVQARGARVRELGYDPNGTGVFRSTDVTLLSPHLVNGHTIKQLAYTRSPESILWALREDGVLLAMTYVPDQQVYGWHQHTTNGLVQSIAVVPESGADVLYMVVSRTLPQADGSSTTRSYVERLTQRVFSAQTDAWFVDAASRYSGTAVTTISGLSHLENQTVQVFADGAVGTSKVVTGGAITLDTPASKVTVGLGYVSDLVTLPLAYEGAPAAGQAMRKNVNTVFLRVAQSSAAKAGPNFSELREYPARQVSDPWDSPPAFRSAELDIAIDPSWSVDGAVCVRQDLPLPLTIVSMALDTAHGG